MDRRGTVLDTVRQRGAYTHSVANRRRWVAMAAGFDLWLHDLDRGTSTPVLTNDMGQFAFDPIWSPDDASLSFGSCSYGKVDELPKGIHRVPVDECRRVTDWTKDGRYLIIELGGRQALTATVAAWDVDKKESVGLFEISGILADARVSPDGRWIAYMSSETGVPEVYVRRFLASGRAIRLTSGGARSPRWRADGREFYYQTSDGLIMAVPVPPSGDIAAAVAAPFFLAPAYARLMLADRGTSFDVTPDGQQFVLRMDGSGNHAVLMQNWAARLEGGTSPSAKR
ncbi:MAG: PD40 domain-containing protein [Gemmatimonadetes bacterium]|nr:PD40 domain-containing protein [Gemmatimonadota bacterium]